MFYLNTKLLCPYWNTLYKRQIGSRRIISHSTGIQAKPLHPSKRRTMEYSIAVSLPRKINSETEMLSEAEDSVNGEDHSPNKSRGYNKTEKASKWVRYLNVSTKKATSNCRNLYENGVEIGTYSQSGIYKSMFRKADQLNQEMKE